METRNAARAAIAIAAALLAGACPSACRRRVPLDVVVTFVNSWRLAGAALSADDQAIVKRTTLDTLRSAFEEFDVRFDEARNDSVPAAARIIRVEDTPYSRPALTFGAAGVTYPATRVSSVRFDVLVNAELAAAACPSLARCTKTRSELLEGLGRGIGSTAAHELGHQGGLEFARDSACDDCYDGTSSASYAHFFGRKHWSDRALRIMRRTLPPDALH